MPQLTEAQKRLIEQQMLGGGEEVPVAKAQSAWAGVPAAPQAQPGYDKELVGYLQNRAQQLGYKDNVPAQPSAWQQPSQQAPVLPGAVPVQEYFRKRR